ncbi:alpha/beta hydrolase [Enterovibrio norvegicus]|uniref:alpha/beta fold hydrolase n=1 Tax=Enterovibrio norvegicus TaxID=188144 RepID=UPI0002EB4EC4|nr:alpha/beta hydrolase [Enterovibrio norvegicus]OEF63800.1 alpha/beta hydrolase [Enterovibrio norvegicus]
MNCLRVGSGPTLVLVHGFLSGLAYWEKQIELFSSSFDVVAMDLPGYNGKADEVGLDSVEGFARYVLNRLDAMGIEKFHLMGHSMGGMIAQEVAIMAPERVVGLVLYATGPVGSLPGRFESIEQSIERAQTQGTQQVAYDTVRTWFSDGEDDPEFKEGIELANMVQTQTYVNGLLAMAGWRALERLDQIEAKTLVLWPDSDRSYLWPQPESLWQGIADANLAVVPQAAHNTHLEKTHIFNMLVVDFLKSEKVKLRHKALVKAF